MTKLIDADKLKGYLDQIHQIWAADPEDSDITFVLKSIIGTVESGRFDAADEFQPEEPRQTLVEALEGAPVGTRYRHKRSASTEWILVVSPGKSYSGSIYLRDLYADGPKEAHNRYEHSGLVRYADEFIIEYPTY